MKYLFECICGAYAEHVSEGEPGCIEVCPHCDRHMVFDPVAKGRIRPATEADLKADAARHEEALAALRRLSGGLQ